MLHLKEKKGDSQHYSTSIVLGSQWCTD